MGLPLYCMFYTFRLLRKNAAARVPQVAFTGGSLNSARACPSSNGQALFRLQPVYFKRTNTLNIPLHAPSFYGVCPSLIALLFYFLGTRSILPGKMRRNQLLLFRHYPRPLRNRTYGQSPQSCRPAVTCKWTMPGLLANPPLHLSG